MWSNLDSAHPPTLLPENYSWVLNEGSYKIKWHTPKNGSRKLRRYSAYFGEPIERR